MTSFAAPKYFTGTVQLTSGGTGIGVAGLAVVDTSGATNTVTVYDGFSNAGYVIASETLTANTGMTIDFNSPRRASTGIYVETTAAVRGTVWLA